MPSKTSFFNKTVFWHDIKRWWPLTAGYALVWLLLLPLTRLAEMGHGFDYIDDSPRRIWAMQCDALNLAGGSGYWLAFFFGILFAMAAFSYLTNPRATNGLHALSARRETLYVTHCLAGLCSQLGVLLLTAVLTAAVLASRGALTARAFGWLLLVLMLPTVFFYLFGVFCMVFTGQILAAPVFYGVLNILVVGVETLVRSLAGNFLYGWSGETNPTLTALSPIVKFIQNGVYVTGESYTVQEALPDARLVMRGVDWLVIYAAVGLIFAVLGLLVYRTRQSEATGNVVAIGWARPVFKYGVSFCAALALGQLFYYLFFGQYRSNGDSSLPVLLACMAAAGLIGYFAAEMLLKKSFRVFKSGWKGAAVVAGMLVLLGVVVSFDLTGYEHYIPDVEQVESASLDWYAFNTNFSVEIHDRESIRLLGAAHDAVVRDKQRQLTVDLDKDGIFSEPNAYDRFDSAYLNIRYKLKGGRIVTRCYSSILLRADELNVPDSPTAALTALYNAPEVAICRVLNVHGDSNADPRRLVDLRFTGGYVGATYYDENDNYDHSEETDLTAEQARLVFEAIVHDTEAGRIKTSLFGSERELPLNVELYASCRDAVDFGEPDRRSCQLFPQLTEDMTETLATLRAMDIDAQLN